MKKEIQILKSRYLQSTIFFLCIILVGILSGFNMRGKKNIEREQLEALTLDETNKLMIVAHPDDETIWGGGHLLEGGYFVVCITNGENEIRKEEFLRAVKESGNIPLILSYPDKEFGMRSRWWGYIDDITTDIKTILSFKKWDIVVTHNLEGEYGHIHHKMVSALVTGQRNCAQEAELYYFGKYYKKGTVSSIRMKELEESILEKKEEILKLYLSQKSIWKKFGHMFSYEDWEKIP